MPSTYPTSFSSPPAASWLGSRPWMPSSPVASWWVAPWSWWGSLGSWQCPRLEGNVRNADRLTGVHCLPSFWVSLPPLRAFCSCWTHQHSSSSNCTALSLSNDCAKSCVGSATGTVFLAGPWMGGGLLKVLGVLRLCMVFGCLQLFLGSMCSPIGGSVTKPGCTGMC